LALRHWKFADFTVNISPLLQTFANLSRHLPAGKLRLLAVRI
jgi:hypothetical protein